MSRVVRESNVAQAIRETFIGFLTFPAGLIGVFAHHQSQDQTYESSSSTLFLLSTAVLISVLVRETSWLVSFAIWTRRQRKGTYRAAPRIAQRRDYLRWVVLYAVGSICIILPLVIFILQGKTTAVSTVLEPVATGLLVGILTGELLSGGIIAGIERWGNLTENEFSSVPSSIIIALLIPSTLLALTHSLRTILAICGRDVKYLTYLKACRWNYDAHSEALARMGDSGAVLVSTAARPFLSVNENGIAELSCSSQRPHNANAPYSFLNRIEVVDAEQVAHPPPLRRENSRIVPWKDDVW